MTQAKRSSLFHCSRVPLSSSVADLFTHRFVHTTDRGQLHLLPPSGPVRGMYTVCVHRVPVGGLQWPGCNVRIRLRLRLPHSLHRPLSGPIASSTFRSTNVFRPVPSLDVRVAICRGVFGTRPWWLALLACGSAHWPLALETSALTSRHPYYCGHPHCRGHPCALGGGIQNATSAHGVLPPRPDQCPVCGHHEDPRLGGAYWPLAFETSAMTSRHPGICTAAGIHLGGGGVFAQRIAMPHHQRSITMMYHVTSIWTDSKRHSLNINNPGTLQAQQCPLNTGHEHNGP